MKPSPRQILGFVVAAFAMSVCGQNTDKAPAQTDAQNPLVSAVAAGSLDPSCFAQWMDGSETRLQGENGEEINPKVVIWTQEGPQSLWCGIAYGQSKQTGVRHLRIGFETPVELGSLLARGGGRLSVLKPDAPYPGDLTNESQWLPAERIEGGKLSIQEAGDHDFALWILPPKTTTRALRFTHEARPEDSDYACHLGGVFPLKERMANLAPWSQVYASDNSETAARIINEKLDDWWNAWDNWNDQTPPPPVTEKSPWLMLVWPAPVTLRSLPLLFPGASEISVEAYTGPVAIHPRENPDPKAWREVKRFSNIANMYPIFLPLQTLDFDAPVTTRAIKLIFKAPSVPGHPHIEDKIRGGHRVWLDEALALKSLGDMSLAALIAENQKLAETHSIPPPISISFNLKEDGFVTLVVEDQQGKRVRNLMSETWFPAGKNTTFWDGMDDLGRDVGAAAHGLYHVPGKLVEPGSYQVRGLFHKEINLRYEFTIYNPGVPPWNTADSTGNWMSNHSPPQSAVFVPGDRAPGGKPCVYLGSYVAEGRHDLIWVDLDGKKLGGKTWVGGIWTGSPFLARDCGPQADPDASCYSGSVFSDGKTPNAEIHLAVLCKDQVKMILKRAYRLPDPAEKENTSKSTEEMGGLAVNNGLLVAAMTRLNKLLFVNAKEGKLLGEAPLPAPRGMTFDAQGRLLVLSDKRLVCFDLASTTPPVLPRERIIIAAGLENPQQIATDDAGHLYISDGGNSHQVKVFAPDGKFLRAIGKTGPPAAGPYDPLHMNNPAGLTVDEKHHLWVAEKDFQPKRVSVWTLDGKLLKAFYGPPEYGGGGSLDPQDKTLFYYHGMRFKLDWEKGANRLEYVFYRPTSADLPLGGIFSDGPPETPLYRKELRYFTNCYNSNPTNGSGMAFLFAERDGRAVPVAAMGRAQKWSVLKQEDFLPLWPAGIDPKGDPWKNSAFFIWSDINNDGKVQPDEVTMLPARSGGVTIMPDLSFVVSQVNGDTMRYAPKNFTKAGVPVYSLPEGEKLAEGVKLPTSSGGDQALVHPDGWTVITLGVEPYHPYSLCGVFKGEPRWSYPSLWPGLHASHESALPDRPGMLIGTTRLLGGFVTPKKGDAGPLWCVNGNMGDLYLFTADGLFVATLFRDARQGESWAMPKAERGMSLNDLTLHDENFWPSIAQLPDGQVYLQDGDRSSLVRVEGLESIQRLPDTALTVTKEDLRRAQAWIFEQEAARQQQAGYQVLKVPIRSKAPALDAKLDDWKTMPWAVIDKSGTSAWFNSNSRPFDLSAAVCVAEDRFYAAFRTGDEHLLANKGSIPNALFKTGGALDLMLGTQSRADPKRAQPVAGDVRLIVSQVGDQTKALLYRAVAPGTKPEARVSFSSFVGTVYFDQVQDVSDQVRLTTASGNYVLAVPLAVLGLQPRPGMKIKADIGVLIGNGFETTRRAYWNNKATGITSDAPTEAMLTPHLWGEWEFE